MALDSNTSDRGLISIIYKVLKKHKVKNTNGLIKMAMDMNREFFKKYFY